MIFLRYWSISRPCKNSSRSQMFPSQGGYWGKSLRGLGFSHNFCPGSIRICHFGIHAGTSLFRKTTVEEGKIIRGYRIGAVCTVFVSVARWPSHLMLTTRTSKVSIYDIKWKDELNIFGFLHSTLRPPHWDAAVHLENDQQSNAIRSLAFL